MKKLLKLLKEKWLNFYYHWKVIKEAYTGQPWDFCFILDLERAKLEEMEHYFRYHGTAENHIEVSNKIALMIKMLDIFTERTEIASYTVEGDEFLETDPETGLSQLNDSKVKYECLVNVNLRNIDRFIKNESEKKYCLEHPDELYRIKAHRLYERMRYEWLETFWD
jgi:hypothetical protein